MLDINIENALNKTWNREQFRLDSEFADSPIGLWFINQDQLPTIFSDSWLADMTQLGLDIGSCLIFYRQPHYLYPNVHVDMYKETGKPAIFALNWVIDPNDDSEMIWYDDTPPTGNSQSTPVNTTYLNWPIEDFKNITYQSRCIGNQLTLVKVGIPHNVIVREKARWVISVRFPRSSHKIETWEDAVNYFKPFIKDNTC